MILDNGKGKIEDDVRSTEMVQNASLLAVSTVHHKIPARHDLYQLYVVYTRYTSFNTADAKTLYTVSRERKGESKGACLVAGS